MENNKSNIEQQLEEILDLEESDKMYDVLQKKRKEINEDREYAEEMVEKGMVHNEVQTKHLTYDELNKNDRLTISKHKEPDKILDEDYDYARENLKNLIEKGLLAFKDLQHIATQDESPKAFDSLSKIFQNVMDANEKLLKLIESQKKIAKMDETVKPNENGKGGTVHNNTIFVGTTAELQELHNPRKQPKVVNKKDKKS